MARSFRFPIKDGRLIQVKETKKDKHGVAKGWSRPLNRGSRFIQLSIAMFVWAKIRDFKNWPLNRGPLYTGSTVSGFLAWKTIFHACKIAKSRTKQSGKSDENY